MILYHVTDRCVGEPLPKTFVPRIPEHISEEEDHNIPRTCFAPDTALCIQAAGLNVREGNRIRVYELDTKAVPDHALIDPETLAKRRLVPDALTNLEYWAIAPVTCKASDHIIEAIEIDYDTQWMVLSPRDIWETLSSIEPETAETMYRKLRYEQDPESLFWGLAEAGVKDATMEDLKMKLQNIPFAYGWNVTSLELRPAEPVQA